MIEVHSSFLVPVILLTIERLFLVGLNVKQDPLKLFWLVLSIFCFNCSIFDSISSFAFEMRSFVIVSIAPDSMKYR